MHFRKDPQPGIIPEGKKFVEPLEPSVRIVISARPNEMNQAFARDVIRGYAARYSRPRDEFII
jgi:hypothetical protein